MITTDYLKQPNIVGKFVYPSLTNSEAKTFAFLLQQTLGWNRDSAAVSTSFFISGTKDQMGTGLSDYGQRKAVKALLKRGWIAIVSHQDMRMASHSVKVPVYEICWAAIQRDYEHWIEAAATVVAPPPATVVAPTGAAATVVAPVPQPELPPSRNCSCPLIEHTPLEHSENNIPGYVGEPAVPITEEMTFWEWMTGEDPGTADRRVPVDDNYDPFTDGPVEDDPIGHTKGEAIAPCRALSREEGQGDYLLAPEAIADSDDPSMTDPRITEYEDLPARAGGEGIDHTGTAPTPDSAPPPPPTKVRLAGITYLIHHDGRWERVAVDAAASPASASEQVSEGVGACGVPRTLLRLLPPDYQHVSAIQ